MGETGVSGENHRPVSSQWQTLSHNVEYSDILLGRKTPPKQKSYLFGSFFLYIKIVLFVDSIQEIIMSIFCNTQTLHCIKSTEHYYQFTNVSLLYKDTIEMSSSNLALFTRVTPTDPLSVCLEQVIHGS